ncbi:hypothetical protein RDV89_00490 [Nocardioides zeae]|uniref:Helix-turn-helix domain-containing protein n=1 Tax=Nocardioides imazamoxiresistens TaxID=3231893 RepID=A0ABU3PQP3_9ACTN|nr:hypothetical protein [Nocardioides zeae]MDT9591523.1 hypothetical protein [Nocardioides zeae]
MRLRLNTAIARLRSGDGTDRAARAAGYATRSGLVKALRRELPAEQVDLLLASDEAGQRRATS